MTDRNPPDLRQPCLHCGAQCSPGDARCWFCKHQPFARPAPPQTRQFSISTVLLLTLLIAISLAVFRWSALLGIALALWLVPAAIRTLIAMEQHKWRVPRLSIREKRLLVLSSAVVSAVAFTAGAFCGAFTFALTAAGIAASQGIGVRPATGQLGILIPVSGGVGCVVGIAAMGVILWLGRPSKLHRNL